MLKLKCLILLIINRIFKILNKNLIFESKYGIKSFNQTLKSQQFDSVLILNQINISPNNLYIGFDGLKDHYSLLGFPISDSPHRKLMDVLMKHDNYFETDYFKRLKKGKLDTRFGHYFGKTFFYQTYNNKKEYVLNNTYAEVKVFSINNKYYILDGKHTAALCATLKKTVRCVEIEHPFNHSYYLSFYTKMKKSKYNYTKNINFLKKIYEH
jgi:hypothetical protein